MFRWIISAEEQNQIAKAFRLGIKRCIQSKGRMVFISLYAQHSELKQAIGKDFKRSIENVTKRHDIKVQFESRDSYEVAQKNDVIIGIHFGDRHIDYFDSFMVLDSIILIELSKDELNGWRERWGIDVEKLEDYTDDYLPDVIKKGLEELAETTNKRISHPSSEQIAKTTVRAIYKYDSSISPDHIKRYLIADCGFPADHASVVADYLKTLQEGRRFIGGETKGLDEMHKRWESKALDQSKQNHKE